MCATILPKLNEQANKIKTKPQSINVRIHMDNAHPHNSKMTMSKISELNMERLDHPPFSPDLSPNDFFLYGFVKDQLKGTQHITCEELTCSKKLYSLSKNCIVKTVRFKKKKKIKILKKTNNKDD